MSQRLKQFQVAKATGLSPELRGIDESAFEAPARLFFDQTSLRVSAAAMAAVLTLYPVLSFAQSVPAGVTNVIPDGRTATTVTTSGNTSTVTTNTISGPNAFNSYSRFEIGAGNTGNLILPNGTSNLINLVNGTTPTTINGTLNAYKNGQIGGNVYFADPNGFVVGRSGVVNVGSLNVTTPTREFMNGVIGPGGQINQSAVDNLLAGTVPVSPDGNIRIRGRINAVDAVRLTGQNVFVGGRDQANRNHAAAFSSSVNSTGLRSANGIVVKNGTIQIVAANDAKINSRLAARNGGKVTVDAGRNVDIGAKAKITADSRTGAAGSIAVNAGQDIKVAGFGTVSAKSTQGDGGNIVVLAQRNLTVAANASFDASSAQGNGGFIELSARKTAAIDAIKLNLSAANGVVGTLLIDPYDLLIGPGATSGDNQVMASIQTYGANIRLTADNSITLAAGYYIDTRDYNYNAGALSVTNASQRSSGSVTLEAPTITINGSILTNVINTGSTHWNAGDVLLQAAVSKSISSSSHTAGTSITIGTTGIVNASVGGNSSNTSALAGNISLAATSTSRNVMGLVTAHADISIAGELNGRNVSAVSIATAETDYTSDVTQTLALIGQAAAASVLGVNGGWVAGTARAKVEVLGDANITATHDVTLNSQATEKAANTAMVLGLAGVVPWGASAVVGQISGEATTTVASNAHITAGGTLTAQATNTATMAVSAIVLTTAALFDATAAVSQVQVDTTADIKAGAVLDVGSVKVLAVNTNSFSTSASVIALGAGSVGASVAYAESETNATANLGASVAIASTRPAADASISVEALSVTTKMATSATVSLGTNLIQGGLISAFVPAGLVHGLMTPLFGSALPVKVAAALAITMSEQNTKATIGNGTGVAPVISTPGDVSVVARTIDRAIRSNADAGTTSAANSGVTQVNVNAGVAYGDYKHTASASVGHNVRITARDIGISANTDLPNENDWVRTWENIRDPAGIFSHLNGNFGTVNNIITSYANASGGDSRQLSAAGSVNYFAATNEATAWVAKDAQLTTTGGVAWTTTLANSDVINWDKGITVSAATDIETINVAGSFSALLTGTATSGSSVGGSLNLIFHNNTTIAGIAAGAVVTSSDKVDVKAETHDLFFAIAPTSGVAAGSLALQGIVSYGGINDTTHASIHNLARVSAPIVNVTAIERVSLISVAGSIVMSSSNGVGIANAILDVRADTKAYIGNNADDNEDDTSNTNASVASGYVHADALAVQAQTTGRLTSASIAAVIADPTTEAKSIGKQIGESVLEAASWANPTGLFNTKLGIEKAAKATQTTLKTKPSISIDIAGSTSANIVELDTEASITGATITRYSTGTADKADVLVEALNNTIISAGSGAGAFNFSTGSTTAVAVSGAIAVGILDNTTSATIDSSSITNAGNVAVRALGSGAQTLIGLGMSVATASSGYSMSMSVSVGIITDSVNAELKNSTITGNSSAAASDRQLVVQSYQETDIAIGGGSLAIGNSGGIGFTVTYAEISDPSAARSAAGAALYATAIAQMHNITVAAGNSARIVAGAATVAGGPDANGLAGALVVTVITNSIAASISGNTADIKTIGVSGSVIVTADSAYNSVLSTILREALTAHNPSTTASTGVDFTGAALNGGVGNSLGASILAVAGMVQAGQNNVGASLVVNTISQTHSAVIENAYLTAGSSGSVTVSATDATRIIGVAVGLGIAVGSFAGVASIAVNEITSQMIARVGTDADPLLSNQTTISGGDVTVQATNMANVRGAAGALGIGFGEAAIGLSIVNNMIKDNVSATIAGGLVTASHDVKVAADSSASILTVSVGIAVSAQVGLAGSVATSIVATDVIGSIANADVLAQNNVAVLASNSDAIAVVAGATGIGLGAVGVGLSIVTNKITGDTTASVEDSKVDAIGAGTGSIAVNSGTLVVPVVLDVNSASRLTPPSLAEVQQSVQGLAVVASSHQSITSTAITLGMAFEIISAGVAVNPITNVMAGTTTAKIDDSQIDTRLTSTNAPQIVVTASSQSFAGNSIVAGGVGGFGGAAANAANQMGRKTYASITDSTVGTTTGGYTGNGPAVAVTAKSYQGAADKVIGFAVGLGAAASSGIVNIFNADTQAYVDRGVMTALRLVVTADSTSGFFGIAGAGAAGIIGLAGGYAVSTSNNRTLAYVGNSGSVTVINLKGRLAVNAVSTNTFDSNAIGGALAGGDGYAGMVNVVAVNNVTRAGLYRANVSTASTATQSDADANNNLVSNPAGIQVTANEVLTVNPTTGSGAIGLQGAGEGTATNVAVLGSSVVAESVDSTINVPGAVVITANSTKNVSAQTVTFGAGSSRGIGAATGTILIGSTASEEAMQLLDQNGAGTLSSLNTLTGGGTNYVLSTAGIAAYQAAANTSLGRTATAQEVQDYAKGLFTTLLQKGTPGSSTFILSTSGVTYYAANALNTADLASYNALLANGSVNNGALVLTAAGVTAYQAAATAALGRTASAAEVQSYANGRYQTFVNAANAYAQTQYQAFATNGLQYVVDAAGITSLRSEAQTALGVTALTDLQVKVYANDRYAGLTNASNGSVVGGRLVLNATGIAHYLPAALTASEQTTYQNLTSAANGMIAGGTITLNETGIAAFLAAATAELGRTPSDTEVQAYANTQYQALTQTVKDYASGQYQFLVSHRDTETAADSFSVSQSMSSVRDGITASLSGGTTTAAAVAVSAGGRVATTNMATGAGAGAGIGIGAAIATTQVSTNVAATISQGTINATTVTATATMADGSSPAATVKSHAGAGALMAALGASVAEAHIDNSLTAAIGGTINLTAAGTATVSASDTSGVRSDAFGATIGGIGIGVSYAEAIKTSTVVSMITAGSLITGGTAVRVNSANAGSVFAGAVAGVGGGVGAGAGAAAVAKDTSSVTSRVGTGSTINVGTGTVALQATAAPDAKALAFGVAVAVGGTVGASISEATASPTVLAQIDDSIDAAHATRITSGALNVTATGTYNGTTPATDIPKTTSTPSSTADFQIGGSNAAAWSVAGTGAYFLAVQGTVAIANDNASVSAHIGNFTVLPTGTVAVNANNTTVQVASGTGIAVSNGGFSLGAVVVRADADTKTSATLGNYVKIGTAGQYAKGLTVAAAGTDTSTVRSQSGSGGLYSGAGANGTTEQDSIVTAGIGDSATLYITYLTLTGAHTDYYKSMVDSTQAAIVGASGAVSENQADSTVNVSIGANDIIFVSAPTVLVNGVGTCDVQACAPGVTILAQNTFRENGDQDSAAAAGGGGISGTGASSTVSIGGATNITFGNGAKIHSGFNPVSSPGAISVLATTLLSGTNAVYLSTGGAIQGAGVNSTLNATLNNTITVNNGVDMDSYGTITIGTYTVSTASTKALVSTWGAAAVGVAEATTNVETNQTVTIGANVDIFAFDNLYVTAGRYGFGYYDTIISGTADAHGYVRGIIAVPIAKATTNLVNNTVMSQGADGILRSAQNVYVGGYTGTITPTANSAGHGYILGFIPVTNRDDTPHWEATSVVTINGNITAGYYHNLNIVISCNNSILCLSQTSGLTVTGEFNDGFNAAQYVTDHFDPDVAPVLLGGISTAPVAAFLLDQMYAAGGNVTINANILAGTGLVTAYGSPTITVVNNSNAYLVLRGGAYIPDVAGGDVIFTGGNGVRGTVRTSELPGTVSAVTINNAFNDGGITGPALLVAGAITNLGGVVSISNTLGSYGQTANLSAQQLNVYVPNGAVAVSSTDPSGMYLVGGFPSTEWDSYMTYPGGKIITANSATIAAHYLANTFYQQATNAGESTDANGDLVKYIYGRERNGIVSVPRPGLDNVSYIFLGACAPHTTNCRNGSSDYYFAGDVFFQNMQYYALNKTGTFSQANLTGSQNSYAIYGGQVAIKASIININASIVAGRSTDYNIDLAASLADPLITTVTQINNPNNCWYCGNQDDEPPVYQTTYSGGWLALRRQEYQDALKTNPGANPIYNVNGLVTYNAATNQLSVATINASSGGGNVLLDGQIVSTNTLGRIHLNGGYGNVQINNQTGLDLVLGNINTGNALAASALTSTVKIVDRLDTTGPNTKVYNYTPGVGGDRIIRIYDTHNGLDPAAGAQPSQVIASDSHYFDPTAGTRYQWVMQATIGRTVDWLANTTSAWAFTSGTANAPWVYVKSEYAGNNGDSALAISPVSHLASGTAPQGAITTGNATTLPAFQQRITGGIGSVNQDGSANSGASGYAQAHVTYSGCGGFIGSDCNHGFIQSTPGSGSNDLANWNYNFVVAGWLKLTSSVKADNRIAVDFGGNASGLVNVTSNSNIIIGGMSTNPSGSATFNATRGTQTVFNQTTSNITQTSSQPILTTDLSLIAADAIGSADKPINATITASSGGTFNAQTGTSNINVNLNSAAKLGLVWAGNPQTGFKDVNIIAKGSLTRGAVRQDFAGSAGSDINVRARNINLTSTDGSIGSIADPIKISANATALSGGGFDGGVVNIVANGDIGFTQVAANSNYSGDLRVGLIASASGDVLINVPGGNIYDASGQTAAQALTAAQVEAISQALRLTPLDGAQANALATVTAFDNLMNKTIADYSRIFNKGTKQTGTFLLTSATTDIFRPAVSAALGRPATDADVQTWANAQFGVFVLDAAEINVFRPQVSAALGHTASDTEVQAWANAKYNAAVPTFYQAYGTGFATTPALTAALTNYNAYAQLAGVGSMQGSTFVLTGHGLVTYSAAALGTAGNATYQLLSANGSFRNGTFVLTTGGIWAVGQASPALAAADQSTLQLLQANGSLQNGVYTLTTAGITAFRAAATLALGHEATDAEVQSYANGRYQTLAGQVQAFADTQYRQVAPFQFLTANGSLQNGLFVLTAAGVANFGQAALQDLASYTTLQLLQANGSVQNGVYTLSAGGVVALASAALAGADHTAFQQLTSSANSFMQAGVFTLTPAGIAAFRQEATTALGHAATDAEVQSYASGRYQTLSGAITTYASSQYQSLSAQVQDYANTQYNNLASQIQDYANTQFTSLESTVVYSATPSVALLLLNSSGNVTNGSFVLSATGVLSYASSALSAANYNAFRSLVTNGSVQGGTFLLNQTGLMNTAQAALNADYLNFQNLTKADNGAVTNGTLVLTAAGIAAFRAAATAALGQPASDTDVQTYANAQYQAYATSIQANANAQYQGYVTTVQSAANAQYQVFVGLIRAYFGTTPIDLNFLPAYANQALSGSTLAAFQALHAKGALTNGVFSLTAANIPSAASTSLGTSAYADFQALSALGTVVNGVFTLNAAGLASKAGTVLSPTYQSFLALGANGAVQYGSYQFNNAGVATYAQSGIAAGNQNFQTLVSNGNVVNGALVLTAGGIANLRAAAGAAMGIANPSDTQVQEYANAQYQASLYAPANATYQGYLQTVARNARDQYLAYVQRIADYFDEHRNLVRNPANFSLYARNILGDTDYGKYQVLLNNGTAVLGAYVNDVYTGGSYALNASAAPTLADQVLQSADRTSYNALLTKGTVQNGSFVLASSNIYQNFQTLAAQGTFQSGAFAFTNAAVESNAQSVLSNAFQQLAGYGAVQGNTFVLGGNGLAYYAAAALSAPNYVTYEALTSMANGAVTGGTLVLNANGLSVFRQAAAAALNISTPTDAQVQSYANAQYQGFTQSIQTYGNTQYQANAAQAQTYANTQYQALAQTIRDYIQGQNCGFGCGNNNNNPTDAQIAQRAEDALSASEYTAFQALLAKGTVASGVLTLNGAGVLSYTTDAALQAQKVTTFQSLTLSTNSTVLPNGTLVLNDAALPIVAPKALDAASYLNYQQVRSRIQNHSAQPGDAAALAAYNVRIQTYANTTYQSDMQTIQGYANAQYQSYAQTIQDYGASQYGAITSQIQTYANTQYQADVATIQAYGAAQYQVLNAAGTPQPAAGLQALVTNFAWSAGQLASAIDQSALRPATTTIGEGVANITGHDVTLNIGGSVGTLAPNVIVDLNDLRNGTISYAQQAALAIATTAGSVTFQGIDNNGQLRTGLLLSSLAANNVSAANLTKAELRQTSPVFVNASGRFSATAGAAVYLQSTSAPQGSGATLTVGQITAGGDVNLQAPQSILTALSGSNPLYAVQIINNGNLTLAAGQSIGSAANPLGFRTTGNLVAASAGTGDVYLNSTGTNLNIGRVNARGTVSITSAGDIAGYLPGIAVTGNSVVLNSTGNVGSSASRLSIKVGLGGNLSGSVAGSAYIFDEFLVDASNPAQLIRDLIVGNFTAADGLYLRADAGIVIASSAASANGPVTLTADTIVMNSGAQVTSGGVITIAGLGNVTLAHVESTYDAASPTVVVSVTAGGAILSSDQSQTNVVANKAHSLVSLLASSGVGSLTDRVSFDATSLAATVNSGNIAIRGATSLRATLLSAIYGNVDVVGDAGLRLDSVLAGTAAGASGTFTTYATGATQIGTATSSGLQTIRAAGDANFTTLTATGGDIDVTSDTAGIQGGSLTASGSATLTAGTTNKGTTLTATNGSIGLNAGGLIDWTTLNAATTIGILSTAGGVTLGAATSSGTQTIGAAQNVAFGQLTTNGIAGDVLVTAGSIQGGSIAPAGLARLTATAGITGTGSIVSTELIALTAGGQINWATLDGKTVTVESTGGSATVGNATSKGTLKLLAKQDAGFTQLTTTGLAGDPSDVIVTTAEGAILGGSITSHRQAILTAGADLPLNSPFAANARIVSTGSITSPTLIVLNARGQIDWETLNATTTIDVTSTDGGARVGTATAGGSITMRGKQDVAFDQLTNTGSASDITLTSDNGAIIGGSITSDGAVSLIAAGSITATGATGSGGALNWSMLQAGGSLFLRSLGDAITIENASSGGSMTLWAKYNVTFRQVTTTGPSSNITLRSDEGAVIALGTGLVNVDAGGSVTMLAATTITGAEVRAGGSVEMTAANGRIAWNAISAGTSVNLRSSADVIDIATITSGGTQTLWAEKDVTFTQLTATAGGADITSNTRAIMGGSVSLGGATRMAAKTTISGATATSAAGAMEMTAEETISWNAVNAVGGRLTITSTRETMNIPSLASGGKMTLDVAQNMLITQITTTGIPNDAGDVDVTSHTGRIAGGTIAANGGITLNAPVSITGVSATGATGAVFMNTDGLINYSELRAGTTIGVRSTGAGVTLGTATSDGTQTIRAANDVTFTTLTTTGNAGNVDVTADTGLIRGTTVAARGSATLTAATTNKGTSVTATNGAIGLNAGSLIEWTTFECRHHDRCAFDRRSGGPRHRDQRRRADHPRRAGRQLHHADHDRSDRRH